MAWYSIGSRRARNPEEKIFHGGFRELHLTSVIFVLHVLQKVSLEDRRQQEQGLHEALTTGAEQSSLPIQDQHRLGIQCNSTLALEDSLQYVRYADSGGWGG